MTDRTPQRRQILLALFFAAAMLLRALAAGFTYYPILDDSIQFISYPTSLDYWRLIEENGLFASRPLAILTDLFFVGQFSGCLIVPLLILSALFGLSGVLFWRLFAKYFHTGAAFAVIYALLPVTVEGTYWLSAAARIVPGMFFTALAACCFDAYLSRGGWRRCALYALCALISYGFYEQILVLSFTLSMLQLLSSLRYTRRAWAGLWALADAGIYFAFTSYFGHGGLLASRMEIVWPNTPWYFDHFLPVLTEQIGTAFGPGVWRTLGPGFVRGVCEGVGFGGIVYLILAAAAGVGLYFLTRPTGNLRVTPLGGGLGALLWGVLLAIAPVTPFFIIAGPNFSLRSVVPSMLGLALLCDLLLRGLLRRAHAYAALSGALAAVCLIGCASEVRDYHAAAEADEIMARAVLARMDEMEGRVGLLGMEEYPTDAQNIRLGGHAASVGAAQWSLYGKLAAAGGDLPTAPVPLGLDGETFYVLWNREMKRISGFDQLWLWDAATASLTPMRAAPTPGGGEHDFDLYLPDGTLWGRVREEGEIGRVYVAGASS